tara:strand:+ start:414 stop:1574 length:1161 start_codon:yes stop_codon:yes gene_type:complete
MSVSSENFSNLIAQIVANDKIGVVEFLRSQGVEANSNAKAKDLVKALFVGFKNPKFGNAFTQWADNRYSTFANAGHMPVNAGGEFDPMATQSGGFSPIDTQSGTNLNQDNFANAGHMPPANASGFDPMATQSGGFSPISTQEGANLDTSGFANAGHMPPSNAGGQFDPMATQSGGFSPISTQDGTNLNEGGFANAGGQFDPMATQSGGFSPISTQEGTNLLDDNFANAGHMPPANAGGQFDPMATQSGGFSPISTQEGTNLLDDNFANFTKFDPNAPAGTTGSKFGNFLRGIDFSGLISDGISLYQSDRELDRQNKLIDAQNIASQNELEILREQGRINTQQYEQQLAILREQGKQGGGNTVLYVIAGVVLLAGIGTAIYFATRKK